MKSKNKIIGFIKSGSVKKAFKVFGKFWLYLACIICYVLILKSIEVGSVKSGIKKLFYFF